MSGTVMNVSLFIAMFFVCAFFPGLDRLRWKVSVGGKRGDTAVWV